MLYTHVSSQLQKLFTVILFLDKNLTPKFEVELCSYRQLMIFSIRCVEHCYRAATWKTRSLSVDFVPVPPPTSLLHQETISVEYKCSHEWKDKCLV